MTKKERKERKRRLKSLILLLFLTIILLTTSTYAWFTSNRSVSIDPIDVYIAASSGLLISTDATNWKTVITNDDIITGYQNHKNMLPYNLVPVSSVGDTDSSTGHMKMFRGTVDEDTTSHVMSLTATAAPAEFQYVYTVSNGNRVYPTLGTGQEAPMYIAFDIFLKNDDSVPVDVFLTNGSGVVANTTVNATATDKGLQNAARYAFVQEGSGSASTGADTAIAWKAGTPVKIVEPNYDMHTATGTLAAQNVYGQTTATNTANTAALDYAGVKAAIGTPIALTSTGPGAATSYSSYFGTITNLIRTNKAYSEGTSSRRSYTGTTQDAHLNKIFPQLASGITKFRVYMWVEGQDVDCENSASGMYLTYSIGFTLDDEV